MTEQLQAAIISLAEYEGKTVSQSTDGYYGSWERISPIMKVFKAFNYHESADVLLPVWRKVNFNWSIADMGEQVHLIGRFSLRHISSLILDGNYEQACIQLAEIVEQLKSKA